MNNQKLRKQIEEAFPFVDKPRGLALSFHKDDCPQCSYLQEDLEVYGGRELPPNAIREIHQEMSCLSAEGWRWALPSYLRFCFTKDADHSQMEIEFLIYNLSPKQEYQAETTERLSALDSRQMHCLISFLVCCKDHEHWSEYCPEEIQSGIEFLSKVEA